MNDRAPQTFAFEEIDERLHLLPLAARRALDHAGYKLSLAAWQSLSLEARSEIVRWGAAAMVNTERIGRILSDARPPPLRVEPLADPPVTSIPAELGRALGRHRPLSSARWSELSGLERYALVKTAASRGGEANGRLARAYDEIVAGAEREQAAAPISEPPVSGVPASIAAVSEVLPSTEPEKLPHWNTSGEARMVDVGAKAPTARTAVAAARVHMSPDTAAQIEAGLVPKGDVFAVARIAGIQAAKRTDELIPLCHAVAVTGIEVAFRLDRAQGVVEVTSTVRALDRTGVEMEALVAVTVAALTLYDMLKGMDRSITVTDVALIEKTGGRSGTWRRKSES